MADSAEALVLGAAGAEVSAEDAAEGVGDSGGEPETNQLISSVTRRREEFEYATR